VIEEQRAFVAWWDANVRGAGGKEAQAINTARRELISVTEATAQTGVAQQQVSKWRNRLKDADAYREHLRDGAYVSMWALRTGVRGTTGTDKIAHATEKGWIKPKRHPGKGSASTTKGAERV
jgi:hypothetical protein